MNLFKTLPMTPLQINERYSDETRTCLVKKTNHFVYAVFDGMLQYDTKTDTYRIFSEQGYCAVYRNISNVPQNLLDTCITAKTIIGVTTPIMKTPLRQIDCIEFMLLRVRKSATGDTQEIRFIDPRPYFVLEPDIKEEIIEIKEKKEEEEVIVSKPIKMRGEIDNYHIVERDDSYYINLKDLEKMLNVRMDEDGIIHLTQKTRANKKKESKE